MEISAKAKNIRMSPSKVRLVVNLVRKMTVEKALAQLPFVKKAAKVPVLALLKSAVANAENNFSVESSNLYIKEIFVGEGNTLHRWRARAFGRAAAIRKRGSQVTIVLDEIVPKEPKERKQSELEAPKMVNAPEGAAPAAALPVEVASEKGAGKEKSGKEKAFEGDKAGKHDAADKPHRESKGAGGFAKKVFRRKTGL